MKAYDVSYSTPRKNSSIILLAENEESIKSALSQKDDEFRKFDYRGGSRIKHCRELPLSNVMLTDLSVAELLLLLGKN